MVLCIIALPLFLLLSLFSVKYRRLAKEGWHCLTRAVTLRKCESGLDIRIKAEVTGSLMRWPKAAGFTYRHFTLFSWLFLFLLAASFILSAQGAYNYWQYGHCNGPGSTGFCIFDPLGENSQISASQSCEIVEKQPITALANMTGFIFGQPSAKLIIIEFGCYSCPHTKHAQPIIQEVLEKYNGQVKLEFRHFPITAHPWAKELAEAAECAQDQGKFAEYHQLLFAEQGSIKIEDDFLNLAEKAGMDKNRLKECYLNGKYKSLVENDFQEGLKVGVQGTPTFFINHQIIVGPKPLKTFKKVIEEELKKIE